jgi:hypothetical protein
MPPLEGPHRCQRQVGRDSLPPHRLRQAGELPAIVILQAALRPRPEPLKKPALSDQKGDHRFEVLGARSA